MRKAGGLCVLRDRTCAVLLPLHPGLHVAPQQLVRMLPPNSNNLINLARVSAVMPDHAAHAAPRRRAAISAAVSWRHKRPPAPCF